MVHLMRHMFMCAGVCLLLNPYSTAQVDEPFSLNLSAESTAKAGSDVYVKVSMRNLSAKSIDCSVAESNAVDLRFRFVIRDESGNILKKKASKHPELEGAGSIKMCILDPGQTTSPEENMISNVYNLKAPGKYEIEALRLVDDVRPERQVKSNAVTITIVP